MEETDREQATPRLRFATFRRLAPWRAKPVRDLCERVAQGGTPDTSNPDYWNGVIPWLTPADMGKGNTPFVQSSGRTITELGLANCSSHLLPPHSIIVSTRAPIGHLAINLVPMAINQGCRGLIPRSGVHYAFLFSALEKAKPRLIDLGAGNTFKEVSGASLQGLTLLVPEPDEQQRVAGCLTSLEELIVAQSRQIKALVEHRRGLMRQLFPHDGAPAPHFRFPSFRSATAWRATQLGAVLSERKLKSDGTSRVHSVSVRRGLVDQVEHLGRSFAAADTSHYNLVKPFDVVYTKSPTGDFPYGIVKQSRLAHSAIVSPLYGVFAPVNRHAARIVEAFFDSPRRAANYLSPLIKKGAKNTIQISDTTFLSGRLSLPVDPDEQRQVAEFVDSIDSQIAAASRRLDALKAHKQGLMQQLFPVFPAQDAT